MRCLSEAPSYTNVKVWINVGKSAGFARIREAPNKESKEIGQLDDGKIIELENLNIVTDVHPRSPRTWVEIPMDKINTDGTRQYGYVALWLVSFEPPCNQDAIIVSNSRVRLRDIPDGDLVKWLKPGTPLKKVASVYGWTKVRVGKGKNITVGWVDSEFIQILEEEESNAGEQEHHD